MGKQGPCCHCGISILGSEIRLRKNQFDELADCCYATPLWRNGPPEKPVLCNACGSRWRTKGTLLNYMPMHSGGFGANGEGSGDLKWSRGKKGSHKHGEHRSHKRKEPCDGSVEGEAGTQLRADSSVSKGHEEEVASRSCSGSGISGSEVSLRRSSSSTRDLSVSGPPWDAPIPSKKRSAILRQPTPVDKLSRSLTSLFIDVAACAVETTAGPALSSSSEAPLVEYNKPSLVAVEIGLGSVFVRQQQPVSIAQESESETSSFFMESKGSESLTVIGHSVESSLNTHQAFSGSDNGSALRGKNKAKQVPRKAEAGRLHNEKNLIPNKALLENFPYIKRDVLHSCQSPLVFLEMKDIVNFDTFTGLLTEQEQGQLLQYISSADRRAIPESLKSMFSSAQFEGALTNFQQFLAEGMFDSSEVGINPRLLQHFLLLLSVTDLTGSGWMERCSQLQNRNNKRRGSVEFTKNKEFSKDKLKGIVPQGAAASASGGLYGAQQQQLLPSPACEHMWPAEEEEDMKGSWNLNVFTSTPAVPLAQESSDPATHGPTIKADNGSCKDEAVEVEAGARAESACFLDNSPFLSRVERGGQPLIEGDEDYMDIGVVVDSGEPDSLLFDLPNPMSFHQAELLQQPASWGKTKAAAKEEENDANQVESGSLIMSNTWHMDTSPADWGLLWNSSCVGPGRTLPNGTVLNPGRILM